ncbi:MAG: cation:proton antiporter [Candidatus Thermoplasmatota archaeon]
MYHKDVVTSISPVTYLFATVFFVSGGLSIDPSIIILMLPVALLISVVAIVSKAVVFTLVLHHFNVPLKEALFCGLATGPRGEISLIISANVGGLVKMTFLGTATPMVLLTSIISSSLPLILNLIFDKKI